MTDQYWPGLDQAFMQRVRDAEASSDGQQFVEGLGENWIFSDGKMLPLASPLKIGENSGPGLLDFVPAYHRMIQTIVDEYGQREDVREVVKTPDDLNGDVEAANDPALDPVHLCRIDLLLGEDGGYQAIETNANCPGGLLFTGMASREWRGFLAPHDCEPPPPLEHEQEDWMAGWFLDVAESATGERPDFVGLIRQEGGNRLEIPHLKKEFNARGVDAEECDPEQIRLNADGDATINGRVVRYAYQKLGMQEFRRRRADLDDFVTAVRERKLFVQNGQRGRWVGDSKLCLAVLSDPAFQSLFDETDRAALDGHMPWSRNIALLDSADLDRVRKQRGDYVLKRPLDTRGRGVVIGPETEETEWNEAVDHAVRGSWLVQEFFLTAPMSLGDGMGRHDLAIGAINGRPVGAFSRTSAELRVNVARSGEVHPMFIGR